MAKAVTSDITQDATNRQELSKGPLGVLSIVLASVALFILPIVIAIGVAFFFTIMEPIQSYDEQYGLPIWAQAVSVMIAAALSGGLAYLVYAGYSKIFKH